MGQVLTNVEELSQFSIFHYEKIMRFSQENLVNIQGSYDILDQYFWMSDIP